MNLDYGWGCFQKREKKARTAADPVIVLFKDKYYLFTTMDIGGYRVSDDLITWKDVYFNPEIHASALDIDHYVAPAVAADDNYVYFINFTRDRSKKKVDVIRSADPENGKWEKCGEVRRMADPCLFIDDERFYFYYGLGAEQSTTFFEVNPETFEEIEGTKKVLREYITDVKECTSGYHFGRRELYDEIDASAWMGKFEKIPCPEGAWIVKNNDKYYLQYATPGTICNWYCDIVMESDSANGGFIEQPYNPVSLKVGGFIGGAGHSCVFKDKYGNWWQATSMWIGNHDEFERRIGLFPVSFDAKGRMRTHTVLGDYPMLLPQKKFEPQDISAFGWMLQSFNKACMASSSLSGFEPEKAADENVRTWWSAESGNAGEHFVMNFGKKVQINSVQINFAEQDINPEAPKETDYHAYKLYTSNDGHTWKLLADKQSDVTYTNNSVTIKVDGSGNDNYAIIPIIKSDNWTVTVNGVKCDTDEIAGIFTGVNINDGSNEIVFTFKPSGRNAGTIISLIILIVMIVLMVIDHKRGINVPQWLGMCASGVYLAIIAVLAAVMFAIPLVASVIANIQYIL